MPNTLAISTISIILVTGPTAMSGLSSENEPVEVGDTAGSGSGGEDEWVGEYMDSEAELDSEDLDGISNPDGDVDITDMVEDDDEDEDGGVESADEDGDDGWSVASDADVPVVGLPCRGWSESRIAAMPTSEEIKNLFRRVADLLPFSSSAIRALLKGAERIISKGARAATLRHEVEGFIKRILNFCILIGEEEKASGTRDLPGTPISLVLIGIKEQLGGFNLMVADYARHGLARRASHTANTRAELGNFASTTREWITEAQNALRIGTLGRLQKATVNPGTPPSPRAINTLIVADQIVSAVNVGLIETESLDEPRPETPFDVPMGLALADFLAQVLQSGKAGNEKPNDALGELMPNKLAFASLEQLHDWRTRANDRFLDLSEDWTVAEDRPPLATFPEAISMAATFAALLCQMESFNSAGKLLEVLVATVRELFDHSPSLGNRLKLSNALGALSTILLRISEHSINGMRAAEEAIALVRPLCDQDPGPHLALLSKLQRTYALTLRAVGDTHSGTRLQLTFLRRAYRVATKAVEHARLHVAMVADTERDRLARTSLALALKTLADICQAYASSAAQLRDLREYEELYQWLNAERGDGIWPPAYAKVVAEIELAAKAGSHKTQAAAIRYLEDTFFASMPEQLALREEVVSILRSLAEQEPWLYEPLLAGALRSSAQVSQHKAAVARCEEAITIFRRLSDTLSPLYDGPLSEASSELALQLRWAHRLAEADVAFEQAILSAPQHGDDWDREWTDFDNVVDMIAARGLLCVRMEKYDEAQEIAEKAISSVGEANHSVVRAKLAGAWQSFCGWVMDVDNKRTSLDDFCRAVLEEYDSQARFRTSDAEKIMLIPETPEHALGLGWAAAAQCSLGQTQAALDCGQKAVERTRSMMASSTIRRRAKSKWISIDFVLPHLLVILAGVRLSCGLGDDALGDVEEVIEIARNAAARAAKEVRGEDKEQEWHDSQADVADLCWVDGPTLKTALRIKAHLLSKKGDETGAATVKAEADGLPFQGFAHRFGVPE
ncbi:hypothetical protein OC842_006280 [Tilletia horrida]|uniref:Uncharacterized protein n=1 Tax=Tilletia horrida TaxID=155126 RepID=A0AAN6JI69_9BASI|nr:hypothetical protein OC842_006280 [Tilletia horrida]